MPSPTSRPADGSAVRARIATIDWASIAAALDAHGHAVVDGLLAAADCASLVGRYDDDPSFRSRVVMARHGFGRGEYKYFADPLPDPVASLRTGLFPPLAAIANAWNESLGIERRYPADHQRYRALCRAAGQAKPTPLLLRYGAGDYNCLHRDLYGDEVFPLQVAILLSAP
ncbi:MAG: 2OG-Fe(II) oxygenase, partial [Alphaproteobacteria bacterium]|nr:2OG-Fe(II) oxygenase [Alphaproteobacteria bacterium]